MILWFEIAALLGIVIGWMKRLDYLFMFSTVSFWAIILIEFTVIY